MYSDPIVRYLFLRSVITIYKTPTEFFRTLTFLTEGVAVWRYCVEMEVGKPLVRSRLGDLTLKSCLVGSLDIASEC